MKRGIVVSDLHLLSWRSEGQERFGELSNDLHEVEALVLNGDTFDFRWAVRPHSESIPLAMEWLARLRSDFPHLDLHFLPGNHDCLPEFIEQVEQRSDISVHPHHLVLGRHLFLHGDAANCRMSDRGFRRFRSGWEQDRPAAPFRARLYDFSDAIGASDLAHRFWFRGDVAIRRIIWHLERTRPGWRDLVDECYFGHTHVPLRGVVRSGIRFHNTGSAIRGMEFAPVAFSYPSTESTT